MVKFVDELDKPIQRNDWRYKWIPSGYDDAEITANIELFCDEDFDVQSSHRIYYHDNSGMLIKLTYPTEYIEKSTSEIEDPTMSGEDVDETGRNFSEVLGKRDPINNASFLKGESVKRQLWKQFSRELLSRDIIFDAIILSTPFKSKSERLRVPLSVMIDYKGFRAMAIGFVSIEHQD